RADASKSLQLIVRQEKASADELTFHYVLTAGSKAAVILDARTVAGSELDSHLDQVNTPAFTMSTLAAFGNRLATLVLPEAVTAALLQLKNHHVVIVHDTAASRVPWETLQLGGWFPAAEAGLSRRYAVADLALDKLLGQRPHEPFFNVLLVVN